MEDLQILIVVGCVSHQGLFQYSPIGGDFSGSFRRHNSETFVWVRMCEGLQHTGETEAMLLPDGIPTHLESYALPNPLNLSSHHFRSVVLHW